MFYGDLPDYLKREIAARSNYKDLINICRSSRQEYEILCSNNYFWKLKTYNDFGPFYDIELSRNVYGVSDLYRDFVPNWYETYQYYRSVFSKEFIQALGADPPDANLIYNMIELIDKKGFLIVDEKDDDKGNTALIVASMKGYTDIAQFLLSEEGANSNIKDNRGNTALMLASLRGHIKIARALIKAGADPNIQNKWNWTALMYASRENRTRIVRMLLKAGANLNLQNIVGNTALMLASLNGRSKTVRDLIKAGADPTIENFDDDGNKAIDLARNDEIKRLLLKQQLSTSMYLY